FVSPTTSTTALYTLSLHDALPISPICRRESADVFGDANYHLGSRGIGLPDAGDATDCHAPRRARHSQPAQLPPRAHAKGWRGRRSEEHTSELQSRGHLVCRLLLEK